MFLDREPYIRVWRPVYRIIGPFTRRIRGFVQNEQAAQLRRIEDRLSALETAYHQSSSVVEQVLLSILADRQLNSNAEALQNTIRETFKEHASRWTDLNALQWQALEQLIIALIGNSARQGVVTNPTHLRSEEHFAKI